MQNSKKFMNRMKIHIKHMIEQHSGHEFDHITGRCGCGASIGLWRCIRAMREEQLEESSFGYLVVVAPMRPCRYSEV